jgi:intermembrane space import and assembly protein 40
LRLELLIVVVRHESPLFFMGAEVVRDGKDVIFFVEPEVDPTSTSTSSRQNGTAQSAIDPETGDINWDCPCLGGLTKGPCGEEFKTAFSCFVLSKNEPKGQECVDRFKSMQECFSRYPEVYSGLMEDGDRGETSYDEENLAFENAREAPPGEIVPSHEES